MLGKLFLGCWYLLKRDNKYQVQIYYLTIPRSQKLKGMSNLSDNYAAMMSWLGRWVELVVYQQI